MDSFTQIVLGAAVGEAVLGKKAGRKAILWGAVAGTIPDLDVFLMPFFNTVDSLYVHRGYSHSLLFAFILAPILGYIISKIHKSSNIPIKDWTKLVFWSVFTHPLLDIFTIYGTPIFEPFSSYRVAFNSINVVDFFYTIPLFTTLVIAYFIRKNYRKRKLINILGLIISTLYLSYTLVNKQYNNEVFKQQLAKDNIKIENFRSSPLPGTNFLWMGIAKADSGFYIGLHSVFNNSENVKFTYYPQNYYLLSNISSNNKIIRLKEFTDQFYILQNNSGKVLLSDLRFGKMGFKKDDPFIFNFSIDNSKTPLLVSRKMPLTTNNQAFIKKLYNNTFSIK